MRLGGQRQSTNVDDVRGMRMGRVGGLGCGGTVLVLLAAWIFGIDPLALMQVAEQVQPPSAQVQTDPNAPPATDEASVFVRQVLGSTEDVWTQLYQASGSTYEPPRLTLFSGQVPSACGMGSAASGPFYCPADSRVYLDNSFFAELGQRFGAPGDVAAAYVVAHEVAHHVQNLNGLTARVQRAREQARSQAEANRLSVALELQADCLAGVWGHHASHLLEPGDVEEGLGAAAAIGDDRLQRQSTGYVQPESFTHGSSDERVAALRRGLETGDPAACDLR
jgi:predicted metalloprotease